ncbi:heterokaryon incompatibility protein-domain-containing protein [Podospora appendiculata]|uniref:Heterokaryon incompatibility protein-domain-containing protein n=1 Tax=Podospora appendiculata TaxID=314037 RepID=A0AAE1CGH4_9PEZI|nr:heterokaryon incompatibility protein-domain-containing protein [Podospora appendiculata]
MRLLNVTTLEVQEFYGANTPQYAILSHTWGNEEITLPEIEAISKRLREQQKQSMALHKAGYAKILSVCKQAARDGLQYVWVDTCCIDKTSGPEISEAINSMFAWYQQAMVCYVYMEDVLYQDYKQGYRTWEHDFVRSRWFTRGWTLQELLAPERLVFFSREWERLGTKSELSKLLEKTTKIDEQVLLDPRFLSRTCISQRMSWAANRKTTRPEDTAYSLMGIFSVNMPPLYGEGAENAFVRLQEAILNTSDDHTIFAWGLLKQDTSALAIHYDKLEELDYDEMIGMTGILAKSPSDFTGVGRVVPATSTLSEDAAYKMTNKGLKIKLKLVPTNFGHLTTQKFYLGVLNCQSSEEQPPSRLGMLLTETETPNVLFRTRTRMYSWVSGAAVAAATARTVYICQNSPARLPKADRAEEVVWIKARDLASPGYEIIDIQAKRARWNREFSTLRIAGIADKVFYQLAVITFFNKHTKRGFSIRVLDSGNASPCFVDLSQSKAFGEGRVDLDEKALIAEAKRMWRNPGKVTLAEPAARGNPVDRQTVVEDMANPELYGTEKQPGWHSRATDDGWEAAKDGQFSDHVTFTEVWEKEYQRTVEAKVARKGEVIVLDISSTLWQAATVEEMPEKVEKPFEGAGE